MRFFVEEAVKQYKPASEMATLFAKIKNVSLKIDSHRFRGGRKDDTRLSQYSEKLDYLIAAFNQLQRDQDEGWNHELGKDSDELLEQRLQESNEVHLDDYIELLEDNKDVMVKTLIFFNLYFGIIDEASKTVRAGLEQDPYDLKSKLLPDDLLKTAEVMSKRIFKAIAESGELLREHRPELDLRLSANATSSERGGITIAASSHIELNAESAKILAGSAAFGRVERIEGKTLSILSLLKTHPRSMYRSLQLVFVEGKGKAEAEAPATEEVAGVSGEVGGAQKGGPRSEQEKKR